MGNDAGPYQKNILDNKSTNFSANSPQLCAYRPRELEYIVKNVCVIMSVCVEGDTCVLSGAIRP